MKRLCVLLLCASIAMAAEDPLVAWWRSCSAAVQEGTAAAADHVASPPVATGGIGQLHLRILRAWAASPPEGRAAAGGLLARSQDLLLNLVQALDPEAVAPAVPGAGDPVLLASALPPERPDLAAYAKDLIGQGGDDERRQGISSALVEMLTMQRRRANLWATQPQRATEFYRTDVVDVPVTPEQWEAVIALAVMLHPGRLERNEDNFLSRQRLLLRYRVGRDCPPEFLPLVHILTVRRSDRAGGLECLTLLDAAINAAQVPEMAAVLPMLESWAKRRRYERRIGWTDEVESVLAVVRLLRQDAARGRAACVAFRAHADAFLATLPAPAEAPADQEPPRIFGYSRALIELDECVRLAPVLAAWSCELHDRCRPLSAWTASEAAAARADLYQRIRAIEPTYPDDPDPSRPWMCGIGYPLFDLLAIQERFAALPEGDMQRSGVAQERDEKVAELVEAHAVLMRELARNATIGAAAGVAMPVAVPPLHLGLGLPAVPPPPGWSDERPAADAALTSAARASGGPAIIIAEHLIRSRQHGVGPTQLRAQWQRLERRARMFEGLAAHSAAADLDAVCKDLGRSEATVMVAQLDAARSVKLDPRFAAAAEAHLREVSRPAVGTLTPRVTMTRELLDDVFAARATKLGKHWAELALWVREAGDAAELTRRRATVAALTALTPSAGQATLLAGFHDLAIAWLHPVAAAFAKAAGDPGRAQFLAALEDWMKHRETTP